MPLPQVASQRIRAAFNIAKWLTPSATDVISGDQIQIANGADLTLELMFSDGALADGTVVDFTNIDRVVVALLSNSHPHNQTTYWAFSVNNADIANSVTATQFNAAQPNTLAQVTVNVPNASNSFALSQSANQPYWVAIYGVTKVTGKQVPYAFFQVSVLDTGIPIGDPTLPQAFKIGSLIPFVCADGLTRDATLQHQPSGLWAINVNQAGYNGGGQATYSLLCSDGFWRDLSLALVQGYWTFQVGQSGHS